MAKKKRRFEQLEAAASAPNEKVTYVDPLQQRVGERLEGVGKKLEGRGKTILYGIGALIVVIIIATIFINWSRRTNAAAQSALGKAIETSQAQISDTGAPAGSTEKTYKTEKERSDAAIAEFQAVCDKYSGAACDKAKYFIAVNKLYVDRAAAIQELESMANSSSESGKMAKFALAQTRVEDNRLDDAAALYKELLAMDDPIIPKDSINMQLAEVYEKQGNKQGAADIYFDIAKRASEAKDADDKPITPSQTATDAKTKLKDLDPERAKQIPEPTPESPFGS